ncbi:MULTISPECIES: ferritin-like domain-containing protein [Dethiosulfovibrio]|uniref:Ferritin-like domain-containing protein n=2 Tax=Dethiosulfovibrio TaxID=47054 RepID=A0ABS9EPR5_9BACT|nr:MULTISPECIES: ferritin-like domain-containing protein [Dethiosulfovibrio]MCF4114121.1 ferritin-like domain-containing protein [Dethiosulfovibrio russensis]MCF4142689.1 ferritin-like domain-containing protein [Dethiosulfovibrio marinus]MCF4144747.1 ferritin-like domain-containing protein [Dethiosulfovibrio acidaminovorans]
MAGYFEPYEALDDKTREISRAISSLREELEAVDYYNQRVSTSTDAQLKAIMAHNRDEEIEHACMTIEWLRRNMDKWDDELRDYLFTEAEILSLEDGGDADSRGTSAGGSDLGLGKLS